MSILIYGAGQIGAVVASILYECGQEIVGFIDDRGEVLGSKVAGLAVLGNRAWLLKNRGNYQVCNAVGRIKARKAVAVFLDEAGIPTVGAIHPTAIISPEVYIGPDVVVGAGCVFYGNVTIGRGCYIGPSVTVSHDTVVGKWVLLSVGTVVGARVDIADEVFVGSASTLMAPGFGENERLKIGHSAVVGAGSLVIRDVPEGQTVIGRPAKKLEKG
jgi:sugar O-acyltransferase (sialic acid O-acetyltransferase NeuD family)